VILDEVTAGLLDEQSGVSKRERTQELTVGISSPNALGRMNQKLGAETY
jgi:hypothetical protein